MSALGTQANAVEYKEYVRDVMNRDPHKISKTASLVKATEEMLKYDCGFLIVTDNGKADGVITDRDIVIFGIAEGKDPKNSRVEEVMTKELITCYEDETLEHAADHISENDIRRLVVLDRNDRIAGVVSIVDMIKHVEDDSINFEVIKHLFKYA
jgi:CBS domain-containing protein